MNDLNQKINSLWWLKNIGVDYYFSEAPKEYGKKTSNLMPLEPEKKSVKINKPVKELDPKFSNVLSEARKLADISNSLEELKLNIDSFEGCQLKVLATNTVFSDGNPKAQIMLVGEAPGANEDLAGKPFCGESGKLLDNMLAAIGLSRTTNAYITNTVFWRPPANRTPTQEEIDICRPFVEKHISLVAPKLIILVGSTASTTLLGKHEGITKIRQEYYSYSNQYLKGPIPVTAIFHPAYLLRQPFQKKTAWYDLLKIQQFIKEKLS